jgi:hypothetical protein
MHMSLLILIDISKADSSLMPGGMFTGGKNMPNFAAAQSSGDFSIVPVA